LANNTLAREYDERNIIDLTCFESDSKSSRVSGSFAVYQKPKGDEVFRLLEQHPSEFAIFADGKFDVPKDYYMPNLRNMPSFPDKDIKSGESWEANAELVLNIFSRPFKLTFPVKYTLSRIDESTGKATLEYSYVIDYILAGGAYPPDFPVKITGRDQGTINWDLSKNRPDNMKEKYRIIFFFGPNRQGIASTEYQMIIDSTARFYPPVSSEDRERDKMEIEKEVPKDITVDTDKRGIVLRLGDVLFDFDKYGLRADTRDKLDRIIGILKKKYPDREIIVEGHTDSIGGREYNDRLSENRARSVARHLKPRTGHDRISFRGYGSDKPIAPNDSAENRQKNRRVEIIIKLN
jgi:outer membrane protein OmpA-like peptidoglycan-associated protein